MNIIKKQFRFIIFKIMLQEKYFFPLTDFQEKWIVFWILLKLHFKHIHFNIPIFYLILILFHGNQKRIKIVSHPFTIIRIIITTSCSINAVFHTSISFSDRLLYISSMISQSMSQSFSSYSILNSSFPLFS